MAAMTYRLEVERDDTGYWIADALDVPGAHTFARRLDQIPERIAEAIAVALDLTDDAIVNVKLDVHLAPALEAAVTNAHERRHAADLAAPQRQRCVAAGGTSAPRCETSLSSPGSLLR